MTYIKGRTNKRVFEIPDSVGESMVKSGHVMRATKAEFDKQRKAAPAPAVEDEQEEPETVDPYEPTVETPNSEEQTDEQEADVDEGNPAAEAPAGNASAQKWAEHALALGYSEEQVEGLGRDELKKLVG